MDECNLVGLDRRACIRILNRLRCGTSPTEGIGYLSVGLAKPIARLQEIFQDLAAGAPRLVLVQEPYGDGKTHMLELAAELARGAGLATATLVHHHKNLASLHRPSMFLQHLLRSLQWHHPELVLDSFERERFAGYSYDRDRMMRQALPDHVAHLCRCCRDQAMKGLVLILDELENTALLHWRSLPIAQQVLAGLCRALPGLSHVGLVVATTEDTAVEVAASNLVKLAGRPMDEGLAPELVSRLAALHGKAFDWTPTLVERIDPVELYRAVKCAAPISSWRALVQRVVYLLEVEHQQSLGDGIWALALPAAPARSPLPDFPVCARPPVRGGPTLFPGDIIRVARGPLRGFVGSVHRLCGDNLSILLGQTGAEVELASSQVHRLQGKESRCLVN